MDEVLCKFCRPLISELVGFFVFRVSGVAFYPRPADIVLLNQTIQFFP